MSQLTVDLCIDMIYAAEDLEQLEEAALFTEEAFWGGTITQLQRNVLRAAIDERYIGNFLTRSATTP